MNLHENKDAFSELVAVTAQTIGLPQVYIEKDYWLTKSLKHISNSPYINDVVFKGGTSLSKAYRLIERFSEDIDLAVFVANKGDSARKKLFKNIERIATQDLIPLDDDERTSKGSKFRKTVYEYPKHINDADFGSASPLLLVEINAFTNPEPFESCKLQTFIAEVLNNKGKPELIKQFGLESFSINVLSVRRTLVEKILRVVKDSYSEDPIGKLSKRIRHLYDVCQILK